MTIYDAPGITYDGAVIEGSMVDAVGKIEQVWQHMNLDSLTPGGFTKEAVASAVVDGLKSTTIPVDVAAVKGDAAIAPWPTSTENADAVWSKTLP